MKTPDVSIEKHVSEQKPKNKILHVRVGSDTWKPTPEQLQDLSILFSSVVDHGGAVITVKDVDVTVESRADFNDKELVVVSIKEPLRGI